MFQPFQIDQEPGPLLALAFDRVGRVWVRKELQETGAKFGCNPREVLLRKPFKQLCADVVVHEIASGQWISIRI